MGAERGHRENGSEYCLLYLHLPDISFEQHALCFNGASSRNQPSHSQVSRALRRPTSATWHVMPVRGPSVPREARRRQTKDIIAMTFRSLALPVDGDEWELGESWQRSHTPAQRDGGTCAACCRTARKLNHSERYERAHAVVRVNGQFSTSRIWNTVRIALSHKSQCPRLERQKKVTARKKQSRQHIKRFPRLLK